MIKKIILSLALCVGAMPAFAQFTTGGKHSGNLSSSGDYTIKTGYKGMVDFGYAVGVGDWGTDRVELQTTHGCQINPYFFAGAGLGVSYYTDGEVFSVPIFADFRGSLPISDSKVSPFLDLKLGYAVADVKGFYFSPSAGVRVAIGQRTGLNFSIGYELQKYRYEFYFDRYYYEDTAGLGAITFKVGFDF